MILAELKKLLRDIFWLVVLLVYRPQSYWVRAIGSLFLAYLALMSDSSKMMVASIFSIIWIMLDPLLMSPYIEGTYLNERMQEYLPGLSEEVAQIRKAEEEKRSADSDEDDEDEQ